MTAQVVGDASRYTLSIDLNVLNHLGLNLYSNAAAALSEAVANAWDADAGEVRIVIDEDRITIADNGVGMDIDDVNKKFLNVGYGRREKVGELTAAGRPAMGRKGIGKLALFSIADEIIVYTRREGVQAEGFRMTVSAIQEAIKDGGKYFPTRLNPPSGFPIGTILELDKLKNRSDGRTRTALRRRLARRFAVIGTNEFRVWINEDEVTFKDRDDLKAVQFLWQIGQPLQDNPQYAKANLKDTDQFPQLFQTPDEDAPEIVNPTILSGDIPGYPDWNVRGWIGTSKSVAALKSSEDSRINSLNSIVIISRGRLIQEDILPAISEARIVRQYLTGQVEADFLDASDRVDIATSDRQRIKEDDPRYVALTEFVNDVVKEIARKWTDYRGAVGAKEVIAQNPALAAWVAEFKDARTGKLAHEMISRIMALPLDKEIERPILLRQAIFGFERMQVRGQLDEFVASLGDPERARLAFETLDALESALYAEIVRTRLGVINALQTLVDDRALESAFQEHLYTHLWLLDPSWERATDSPTMEQAFRTMVKTNEARDHLSWADNRVDIQYVTTAGKQVIIELKKADRTMRTLELIDQGSRYRQTLSEVLATHLTSADDLTPRVAAGYMDEIEVIFVLGKRPINTVGGQDPTVTDTELRPFRGRVVTYAQLIGNARKAYDEYLRQNQRINRIAQLAEAIMQPAP